MMNLLRRRGRTSSPLVICQFCGNATPFAEGDNCPHCRVAVSTFDRDNMVSAFDTTPVRVRLISGDHGKIASANVRGGYYDRAGTWVRLLGERFDLGAMETATDVGAGSNFFLTKLAEAYPNLRCTGFDFKETEPPAKLRDRVHTSALNLEKGQIPLADRSQDLVVCSHVLEHVENVHQILSEILRVGKNAFVVLPNGLNIFTVARSILKDGPDSAYGLPLERPADRHRWIFTPTQAVTMMRHWAGRSKRNLEVVHLTHPTWPVAFGRIHPNLFVSETVFFLTE